MPKASFHHGSPLMVQPSIESSRGKDQAETHAQVEIGGSSLSGIKLQQNIGNLCKTCPSSESWLAGRTKISFFFYVFFLEFTCNADDVLFALSWHLILYF